MIRIISALTCATALAGCGGSQTTPADQVRDAAKQLSADIRASRWGDACAATTNPDQCTEQVTTATAMGINVADLIPSDDSLLEHAKIIVNGDSGDRRRHRRRGRRVRSARREVAAGHAHRRLAAVVGLAVVDRVIRGRRVRVKNLLLGNVLIPRLLIGLVGRGRVRLLGLRRLIGRHVASL